MTCKDCVHYEVCASIEGLVQRVIIAGNKADERCKIFKPKSRFVELPCEVGSTVWYIRYGEVLEATVVRIEYNYFTSPQEWISIEYYLSSIGKYEYKSRVDLMFGKTVFLSKEEYALSERSK